MRERCEHVREMQERRSSNAFCVLGSSLRRWNTVLLTVLLKRACIPASEPIGEPRIMMAESTISMPKSVAAVAAVAAVVAVADDC